MAAAHVGKHIRPALVNLRAQVLVVGRDAPVLVALELREKELDCRGLIRTCEEVCPRLAACYGVIIRVEGVLRRLWAEGVRTECG